MSTAPIFNDYCLVSGEDFFKTLVFRLPDGTGFDFTSPGVGWTARMDIREKKDNDSTLIIRLDTSDTSITLASDGTIQLDVLGTVIEALTTHGTFFYDLFIFPPAGNPTSKSKQLLQGSIRILESVTNVV